MQIRITLMIAALTIGGAACKRDRDRDERDPTTTAKLVETAPGIVAIAPPDPEPVIQLEREGLAARYKDCVTFINMALLDAFERECVARNFIGHHMDGIEVQGSDRVIEMFEGMQAAFGDFKLHPQLIAVSGRNVLALNMITGTHDHDLAVPGVLPIAKTGKQLGMLFFHRLVLDEANHAVEEFMYSDPLTMLGQLGRLPDDAKTRPPVTKSWPNAPIIAITADDETERSNVEIFNRATAAFNAHDVDAMARFWTPDGLESDQSMANDLKGRAAIAKETKDFLTAFPDVRADFTHLYAAGDYVIGLGRLTATNLGSFGTMKATGNRIDIHFAEVAKLQDGKITQLWRFLNGQAMENQLGLTESKPTPPTTPRDSGTPAAPLPQ